MKALGLAGLLCVSCAAPAQALTEHDLATVSVQPPTGARLPLELVGQDAGGQTSLSAAAAGRPIVFVFADYRCRYLCGPALSLTASALAHTDLTAGRDYRLVVLGLDPRDSPADAAAFAAARLSAYPQIRRAARLLVSTSASVSAATRALGYHYRYDPEHDQFAHPAAAFVLTPQGDLTAALSDIALQPEALQAALRRARSGKSSGLIQRLHALCYAFDPTRGVYDRPVQTALRLASFGTFVAGAGAALWLARRRRRAG
jgi:protein SCO1/2